MRFHVLRILDAVSIDGRTTIQRTVMTRFRTTGTGSYPSSSSHSNRRSGKIRQRRDNADRDFENVRSLGIERIRRRSFQEGRMKVHGLDTVITKWG
jgi:hypothetical protein